MASPSESLPPPPDALDIITGVHAQAANNAENLRLLWLKLSNDMVGARYRDLLYEVACRLRQDADMLDAVGTILAHANRFQTLRSTDPKLLDWHEVPIAPVPALPDGSSAL